MTEENLKEYKYEEYANTPELESIMPETLYNFMRLSGEKTGELASDTWNKNSERNIAKLLDKHEVVGDELAGFAKNKAVIIVGAGPSFNKNKDTLKKLYDFNCRFDVNDQPFVIIASNHMLKPLLNMGIFPHMTVVLDGGNHFRDQFINLNTDMKCVMVANLVADHKMLKRWDRDGHLISFFVSDSEKGREDYKKKTGLDPDKACMLTGGNVLNTAFMLSLRHLQSRFIITVGNDLSFPVHEDADERRKAFYSDGDYSSNTKDEARHEIAWMAYEHAGQGTFDKGSQLVNYTKVLTSHQLILYKTWVEFHIAKWADVDFPFRYYNCSEGGICGVIARKHDKKDLEDPKNWMLMDEIAPTRWFTKPLREAAKDFLEIKESCRIPMGTENDALNTIILPGTTGFANVVAPAGQNKILTA